MFLSLSANFLLILRALGTYKLASIPPPRMSKRAAIDIVKLGTRVCVNFVFLGLALSKNQHPMMKLSFVINACWLKFALLLTMFPRDGFKSADRLGLSRCSYGWTIVTFC